MKQSILPLEKESHAPELDELSNHCQEPPIQHLCRLGSEDRDLLLISFPHLVSSQESANKFTSFSPPASPLLLPLNGYYYSPKSGKRPGLRAANLICSMLEAALMSTSLSRVPGHIFMLVPWSGVPSLPCLACLNSYSSFKAQIKVISSRKTHLHASVIPESLAHASINAYTQYCDLFPFGSDTRR